MSCNMTKIANLILYMLNEQVKNLNDKKLSIMLFLIDYNHLEHCEAKIFDEKYIKSARNPEPVILSELFDIIANAEELDEEDERLYLIQELLAFLDIEIITKDKFVELHFIKMEEEYDDTLFSKDELKTIYKIVSEYTDASPRNIANACFKIEKVRKCEKGKVII
ncbi:MAG: DUF4065 domain-containing protein [Epsilonproteobacteria bacterium]|nr:DUF4065 domain-containing protein [Campylobacterota bacterium]